MAGGKGPGGFSVGRVSLRVVPDTHGFKGKVKSQLESELAGFSVDVKVKPDLTGFREEVKAKTAGMTAKVHVFADDAGMNKKLTKKRKAEVTPEVKKHAVNHFEDRMKRHLRNIEKDLELRIPLTDAGERRRRSLQSDVAKLWKEMDQGPPEKVADAARYRRRARMAIQAFADERDRILQDPVYDLLPTQSRFKAHAKRRLEGALKTLDTKVPVDVDGEVFRKNIQSRVRDIRHRMDLRLPIGVDASARAKQSILDDISKLTNEIHARIPVKVEDSKYERRMKRRYDRSQRLVQSMHRQIELANYRWTNSIRSFANTASLAIAGMGILGPPIITGITAAVGGLAGAITVLGGAISAIGGGLIAGGFIKAAMKSEEVQESWENTKGIISDTMAGVNKPVENSMMNLFGELPATLERMRPSISNVSGMVAELVDHFTSSLPRLADAAGDALENAFSGTQGFLYDIVDALPDITTGIGDFLNTLGTDSGIREVWKSFLGWIPTALDGVAKGFSKTADAFLRMKSWLKSDALSEFREGMTKFWDHLKDADWDDMVGSLENVVNAFGHAMGNLDLDRIIHTIDFLLDRMADFQKLFSWMGPFGTLAAITFVRAFSVMFTNLITGVFMASMRGAVTKLFGERMAAAGFFGAMNPFKRTRDMQLAGKAGADAYITGYSSKMKKSRSSGRLSQVKVWPKNMANKGLSKGKAVGRSFASGVIATASVGRGKTLGPNVSSGGDTSSASGAKTSGIVATNTGKTKKNAKAASDSYKKFSTRSAEAAKTTAKTAGKVGIIAGAVGILDPLIEGLTGLESFSLFDELNDGLALTGRTLKGIFTADLDWNKLFPKEASQAFDEFKSGMADMSQIRQEGLFTPELLGELLDAGEISKDIYDTWMKIATTDASFKDIDYTGDAQEVLDQQNALRERFNQDWDSLVADAQSATEAGKKAFDEMYHNYYSLRMADQLSEESLTGRPEGAGNIVDDTGKGVAEKTREMLFGINQVANEQGNAVTEALTKPFNALKQAAEDAKGAFDGVGEGMGASLEGVNADVQPKIDNLKSALEGLSTATSSNFDEAQAAVGTALAEMLQALEDSGEDFSNAGTDSFSGYREGVQTEGDETVAYVSGLPPEIEGALQGADLSSAGSSIIRSFLSGMQSEWGSVTAWLDQKTAEVPEHKGPPAKDRTLLKPSGQMVMSGFKNGLNTGYANEVIPELERITKDIPSRLGSESIAEDLMRGFNDGTEKGLRSLRSKVESFDDEISDLRDKHRKQQDELEEKFGKDNDSDEKKDALKSLRDRQGDELDALEEQRDKAQDAYNEYVESMERIAEHTPAREGVKKGAETFFSQEAELFTDAGELLASRFQDAFEREGFEGIAATALPLINNAGPLADDFAEKFFDRLDYAFEQEGWAGVSDKLKGSFDESGFEAIGDSFRDSFLQDIGVDGSGVIGKALYNPEYTEQVKTLVFNVNNLDEALEAERRVRREEAAGFGG